MRTAARALLPLLFFAASCASNPVTVRRIELAELVRAHSIDAYDGRRISDRTLALLDRLGLSTEDHTTAVDRLANPIAAVPERQRLIARAELLYSLADRQSPKLAAERFLRAALDSLAAVAPTAGNEASLAPARFEALQSYNYALTRFLTACSERGGRLDSLLAKLRDEFRLEVEWRVPGRWKITDFDRYVCADTLRFTGFRHRYRRLGAGVPLILQRDAARGIPDYLTPEAVTRAVTVMLLPGESASRAGRLLFLDPRSTDRVALAGATQVPLAADFTAAFAYLLSQAKLHAIENRSFFSADAAGHEGLFLLEDYDPKRTPIVMVHGLWSSPLTWRDLSNDVFGDETLHRRYQVWHYMYATGAPLLENARQLRKTLMQARKDLDPELDDDASKEWILIGHSMGGLLSRMSLVATGQAIWNTLFEGSFDDVKLHLEDHDRELARGLYFWKPLSFVKRAIFIAAPHRGSQLADSWIGRLGSSLMYIPRRLRRLVNRIRGRTGVRVEVPTSVDELSGSHPVMRTLGKLPIARGVVFHSIMGEASGSTDKREWTDGVVPYASSHLDGADSELVVPGTDHSVHFDPRASAEVRRILRSVPPR